MILTVCPNPSIDCTIELDNLNVGMLNRIRNKVETYSGKALNAAIGVSRLSESVIATGFMFENHAKLFEQVLDREGVKYDFVNCKGSTRVNYKIIDKKSMLTEINDKGETVDRLLQTELLSKIARLSNQCGIAVVSGSLPDGVSPDFYRAEALLSSSLNVVAIIVDPLLEIVLSLGLGALLGFILTKVEELFFSNSNRLALSIAFVFMTIALSQISFSIGPVTVSFSSLLVCMMLGAVFCNLCPRSGDIMYRADKWTVPLFCLFFVISGADLDLSVFGKPIVILIGVLYIIARSIGKYYGARESCKAVHCAPEVSKYLGFALLPQAGVALGMSVQAQALGTYEGKLIRNIVLFGVLIYELFGPMITKWALTKSGDIAEKPVSKETHERFDTPKDHRRHSIQN